MKVSAKLLTPKDYRVTPWKNGAGKSIEIGIHPPHARFPEDAFQWRLSSAEVTENCQFSVYEGYDRYLTLIRGEPLILNLKNPNSPSLSSKEETVLQKGQIFQFSGECSFACELTQGPAADLGLIVKKGGPSVDFQILRVSQKPRSFELEKDHLFIFGISGQLKIELFPGKEKFLLLEGSTLHLQNARGAMTLLENLSDAKGSPAVAAWIEIINS